MLWLYEDEVTEVGTMNLFIHWRTPDGRLELITPSLDGLILEGITRKSVLELAREWNDFQVGIMIYIFRAKARNLGCCNSLWHHYVFL